MLSKIYAPSQVDLHEQVIFGDPAPEHISMSLVERQNLTMNMSMRLCTHRNNAFSKKIVNHAHSVSLHFMHYNFLRVHSSTGQTPAKAADIARYPYNWHWFIDRIEETQPEPNRPARYRKRQAAA